MMPLRGLHEDCHAKFVHDATGFVDPNSTNSSNIGAAAGAGLGGMVVFHITSKDCIAPPACEQVKECMAEAAKKAFMGSAIMGAAATGATTADPSTAASSAPLDEWSLAPACAIWNYLGLRCQKDRSRLGSFLGLKPLAGAV
ncbi:unnamed protein product [Cladocopium goreaui]|uniref:Cation-chloride cotransporter 2 n=1 Tax=Cladocopium goreaui TaxID=2562237 RepID=A0A9P1FN89_9DINO|nr:unnamed protein product [Cladocopium goreaui]